MASTEPRLTALKVSYKGEIHRIRVDLSVFKLEDLNALFCNTFHLTPGSFVVQYKDPEGDCLNVCSDAEYVEACRVFMSSDDAVKSLRFVAVSRTHVAFQENIADPILKAIEKLVETLNAAMEKVKQEEWAQRAQTKVERTNEAIRSAAKTAANDARDSFVAAKQAVQEMPFDQVLKETAEGIKTAAEGFGAFAQDIVEEIRNMTQPAAEVAPATEVAPVQTEEPVAQPTEEVAHVEEPAPVADSEWEQVSEQASPSAVEETPVMVPAPEPVVPLASEEEQKWAAEVALVRDIFPAADVNRLVDAFDQCGGDVQIVLNSLMEEM